MSQSWKKVIRHCMQECINVSVGKFYNKNEEPWNKKSVSRISTKIIVESYIFEISVVLILFILHEYFVYYHDSILFYRKFI